MWPRQLGRRPAHVPLAIDRDAARSEPDNGDTVDTFARHDHRVVACRPRRSGQLPTRSRADEPTNDEHRPSPAAHRPLPTAHRPSHGTTAAFGSMRTMYSLSLIHISEPTRLLSISYAVFCLKK